MNQGYFRHPTLHGETVVFVCEDDLWSVPLSGGRATRLTAGLGHISHPLFSPDGRWIAYTGSDDGHQEVYVIPAEGGAPKRLTHFGVAPTRVCGWKPDSSAVICNSSHRQILRRMTALYAISPEGGSPECLDYGMAHHIVWGPNGGTLIGRHSWDPARWKRYKGGTKGVFWVDPTDSGTFQPFLDVAGTLANPLWIGDRIWFVADHEGIGNLYSATPDGQDLKRHTHHEDFYVRFPHSDGTTIVYQCGARLFQFDTTTGQSREIAIEWHSPQMQRQRKFASATKYIQAHHLHPEGHSMAVITRGKTFTLPLWEGAPLQYGERDGVRYRAAQYLSDNQRMVMVSDASGEEQVEVHWLDGSQAPQVVTDLPLGRPEHVQVSPTAAQVAVVNHRRQLLLVDLDGLSTQVLDETKLHDGIGLPAWSPDGAWLAYSYALRPNVMVIKLCKVATGETWQVTEAVYQDFSPAFDPDGKYLYFLSSREFNPSYDELHFDLGFPYGSRPYLITLRKDLRSPFHPDPLEAIAEAQKDKDKSDSKDEGKEKKIKAVEIDLEGITLRTVAFPVKEGRYRKIQGAPGKALYTLFPVMNSLEQSWSDPLRFRGTLRQFDFKTREEEVFLDGINSFAATPDGKMVSIRVDTKLRIFPTAEKPSDKVVSDSKVGKKSGWMDLERIKLAVHPAREWEQMFNDAWRRMRDHFWTENMSEVDWEEVRQRYAPLLKRLAARTEYSDLMWEVQGELGTSHAYEMGGDYRPEPQYRQGLLGADWVWDAQAEGYRIQSVVRGDYWDSKRGGPLAKPGLNIATGDVLTAINGQRLSVALTPEEALVNQANAEVTLTLAGDSPRQVLVRTVDSDTQARYRDWVEANRARVHAESGGKIGYVHIPDMGPQGFAEFHRYYLVECNYEALLVDVRFNGGGHVSQLLLDKLARKRLGYDIPRWGIPESYPSYAVLGPILALTDENAGSDGDIFSHSFKMMKLGPLVGKRTWGGVIGINSQGRLVDGSLTTQPEYSFWFHDVGWGVENYGTDPDVVVEYAPHDYKAGADPQLTKGLEILKDMLAKNPPQVPDFSQRPSLKRPPLQPHP
jgi:tricorn protease